MVILTVTRWSWWISRRSSRNSDDESANTPARPRRARCACPASRSLGKKIWRRTHHTSFLIGSFSSVSTATIASEDAFCSIFRDLQDLHSSRDLNLQNFANFRQFIFQNFDKLWRFFFSTFRFQSGAKECKSCRSRKMLQNGYLLAKIGVDRAENEPSKVSPKRGVRTAQRRDVSVEPRRCSARAQWRGFFGAARPATLYLFFSKFHRFSPTC